MAFLEELKRRNIFKVGVAYLTLGWIIVQVTAVVVPALNLPASINTIVIYIGIIGFPLALFLAWAFELTPNGIKKTTSIPASNSVSSNTGRKIDFIIIGLLSVAIVFLLVDKFLLNEHANSTHIQKAPNETKTNVNKIYQSIGVLPFSNMSNDPEQEYFSDGIAEELLNALAKVKTLQVSARTSSFSFKGKELDIRDIGQQLNVETLLEGSVRKFGNKIRITAQLIDVSNGYHLWSETYDRELDDIFAIQDEITAAIVSALSQHFQMDDDEKSNPQSYVTNVEAYEAYLKGKHHLSSFGADANRFALREFRVATSLDPNYAAAWGARALVVMLLKETAFYGQIPAEEALQLAKENLNKALILEAEQVDAHFAQALIYEHNYEYMNALGSLNKVLAYNPNNALALTWQARILGRFGQIKEAKAIILKAIRLDPLNQRTLFYAEQLATDFYDEAFYQQVYAYLTQFPNKQMSMEINESLQYGLITEEELRAIFETKDTSEVLKAMLKFVTLKEMQPEIIAQRTKHYGEYLFWQYIKSNQHELALIEYEKLPIDRQEATINLEELSILQLAMGQCEKAIDTLTLAHGDEIPIHGMIAPEAGRSNSNLAVNRAFCFRKLGGEDKADAIIKDVDNFLTTLKANSEHGYSLLEIKVRILQGDIDKALSILERELANRRINWLMQYDPIVQQIAHEPRFKAVFKKVDGHVAKLREKFGLPALQNTVQVIN